MTTLINYPSCIAPTIKSYNNYHHRLNSGQSSTSLQNQRVNSCSEAHISNIDDSYTSNSYISNELETEICQRFVRLSCEKMLASRNSRSGARLHRSLLILRLLRKAKNNANL